MKRLPKLALLLSVSAASLLGCQKICPVPDPEAVGGTGLVGTWKLTARQCLCPPQTPVPKETIVFTNNTFTVYENGQLKASGTYTPAMGTLCGGGTAVPVVEFSTSTPAPTTRTKASADLSGNTLVLDYGSPCDAARNTYTRVR